MTIWKFPLNTEGMSTVINAPIRKCLKIMMQYGNPTLWAEVDETQEDNNEKYIIACFGTGWPIAISENLKYIDSIIDNAGFVWHYYKRDIEQWK